MTLVDLESLVKLIQEKSERSKMVFYSLLEMTLWKDFGELTNHLFLQCYMVCVSGTSEDPGRHRHDPYTLAEDLFYDLGICFYHDDIC